MSTLRSVLKSLRESLPAPDELDDDNATEVCWEISDVIGAPDGKLGLLVRDGELPFEDQQLFEALVYFQCVVHLASEINSDGLLSVFYNDTGRELILARQTLTAAGDPIAPLFERAFALLEAPYDFVADTNWVTRNKDSNPYEALDSVTKAEMENIEDEIERRIGGSWHAVYRRYREAR